MGVLGTFMHFFRKKKNHTPLLNRPGFRRKFILQLVPRFELNFKTWLFFVISLFIIGIGMYVLQQTNSAKAAWFDETFQYRQRIPITNAGSAQTDFQVGITVNTSSLISAGKMQSDCDDIRFVGEDGTVLPYWIEENNPGCNNSATMIWVKVPSIPTSGINIYLYYGNSSTTGQSSGSSVFPFFDDFNGAALDTAKWTGTGTNVVSAGLLNIATGSVYTKNTILASAQNYMYEYRVAWSNNSGAYGGLQIVDDQSTGSNNNQSDQLIYLMSSATMDYQVAAWASTGFGGSYNITAASLQYTASAITFHISGFSMDSSEVSFYNNRSETNSYSGTWTQAPYLYLGHFSGSAAGTTNVKDMHVDWVLARKYAATPPSVGTFGSEELSPAPVAYWKLDESGGTWAFDSVGENTGTLGTGTSAPTWQSSDTCASGTCLFFDGNDGISYGTALSEISSTKGTISLWFRNQGQNADYGMMMYGSSGTGGNGFGGTNEMHLGIYSTGELGFYIEGGTTDTNLGTPDSYNDGKWHQVVVTWDSTANVVLYIDGVKVNSASYIGNSFNLSSRFHIGRADTGTRFYNGYLDEIKVYQYVRSEEEVKADYANGAGANGNQAVLGSDNQENLSNGLVGYWKMDESSWGTPADSSGNNHSVLTSGNVAPSDTAKFGRAASFDGTGDQIYLPDSPVFDYPEDSFTIATWFRTPNVTSQRGIYYFLSSGGYFYIDITPTEQIKLITQDNLGVGLSATSTATYSDNAWHHLVVTRNKKEAKLQAYVDGKLIISATDNRSGNFNHTSAVYAVIGGGSNLTTMNGQLDDFRIYNRAFTEREVIQLYEWAPGPVLYHAMDANTGTTSYDTSGNGYNGTFGTGNSAPTWSPGKYGSGLGFDGVSDQVVVSSVMGITRNTDFTISTWVNLPDTSESGAFVKIGSEVSGDNDGFAIGVGGSTFDNEGNDLIFLYESVRWIDTGVPIGLGWHHVAMVVDSSGVPHGYIDGTYIGSFSGTSANAPESDDTTKIGGYTSVTPTSRFGSAMLDEVRIYNYPRSQKQIVQDMNAGHPSVGSPVGSAAGHWKFDEGYGTTANNAGHLGSTLNGTLQTGPVWSNDGKFGKAISFDGSNDHITVSYNPSLEYTSGDRAWSVWVKPDATDSDGGYIFSKPWNESGEYNYFLRSQGGANPVLTFQMMGASTWNTSTEAILSAGSWNHIVVTVEDVDNSVNIYLNGTLVKTDTHTITSWTPASGNLNRDLAIGTIFPYGGSWVGNTAFSFKGSIDELKFYSYALTADEVRVEYNEGKGITLGSVSTGVGGTSPSNSTSREYCLPGDTATCSPPVAEWLMNEGVGTTVYDTSENNRFMNFGVGNSTPKWTTGIRGNGVLFDGTNDIIATTSTPLVGGSNTPTSFTVSGWFKSHTVAAGSAQDRIFAQTDASGASGYNLLIFTQNGNLNYDVFPPSGGTLSSNQTIVANRWYHFAVVRNGSTRQIYLNGVLDISDTGGETYSGSSITKTLIGGTHSFHYFDGIIDDVRVYDYPRTAAQIMWEYNKGAPIAWYKFDECEGTTIYNSAPSIYDGAAGDNGTLTVGSNGSNTSVGTCATSGAWADGATGRRGGSLEFDGSDDYVQINDSATFDVGTEVSYAFWVKPDGVDNGLIINKWANGAEDKQISVVSTGQIRFYLFNWSGSNLESTGTVTFGEWNHIVTTYDGTTATIYINGQNAGSKSAASSNIADSTGHLYIGENAQRNGVNGDSFAGQVDDLRIYNYALTPVQVKSIYNNGAVSFE